MARHRARRRLRGGWGRFMPILARAYSANLATFPTLPGPQRNQVLHGQIRHRAGRVGRVGKVHSFASMCASRAREPSLPSPRTRVHPRCQPPSREPGLTGPPGPWVARSIRPVGSRAGPPSPDSPARAGPPGGAPRRRTRSPSSGRRHSKVLYHCGIDPAARPALQGDRATSPRAAYGPGQAEPVPPPGPGSGRGWHDLYRFHAFCRDIPAASAIIG